MNHQIHPLKYQILLKMNYNLFQYIYMNQIIESLFWFPNPYTFKIGILEDDKFIEKDSPYEICEGCINFIEGDEKAVVAILDEHNIIKSYII